MTEEPPEDEPDAEDDPPESESPEDEPDAQEALESAARDEEPDIEGAKADLEAVGDREESGQETANEDDASSDEDEDSPLSDDTAPAGDEASPASETSETAADAEAEPQPEDLVRDPDEPAYTSATEDSVATDAPAATDAEEETGAPAPVEDDEAGTASGADAAAGVGAGDTATDDSVSEEEAAAGTGADGDAPADTDAETAADAPDTSSSSSAQPGVPEDVQTYDRFTKVDGAQYERVNDFLRDRTYITAREWAIARLCSDFRTETGVEMTKIGENLPELVPFMTDTYSPQAVNQARSSFEDKVRTAGATFLYGAMCDFFTAEELDDLMYEATEVAKFLLEVEGVELSVEEELEAEDRISSVMRDVRSSSAELRHERCPECGAELSGGE